MIGMEGNDLRHKICEKNVMYKANISDPQNKELLIEYKKKKKTHSIHS